MMVAWGGGMDDGGMGSGMDGGMGGGMDYSDPYSYYDPYGYDPYGYDPYMNYDYGFRADHEGTKDGPSETATMRAHNLAKDGPSETASMRARPRPLSSSFLEPFAPHRARNVWDAKRKGPKHTGGEHQAKGSKNEGLKGHAPSKAGTVRFPKPETRIPNPESRIPNSESRNPKP